MKYPILAMIVSLLSLTSCSTNEEFEDRMNSRTGAYESYQERRAIRLDARQDRTDAWYDRAMHGGN